MEIVQISNVHVQSRCSLNSTHIRTNIMANNIQTFIMIPKWVGLFLLVILLFTIFGDGISKWYWCKGIYGKTHRLRHQNFRHDDRKFSTLFTACQRKFSTYFFQLCTGKFATEFLWIQKIGKGIFSTHISCVTENFRLFP